VKENRIEASQLKNRGEEFIYAFETQPVLRLRSSPVRVLNHVGLLEVEDRSHAPFAYAVRVSKFRVGIEGLYRRIELIQLHFRMLRFECAPNASQVVSERLQFGEGVAVTGQRAFQADLDCVVKQVARDRIELNAERVTARNVILESPIAPTAERLGGSPDLATGCSTAAFQNASHNAVLGTSRIFEAARIKALYRSS
jgi:hypothetical protein